MSRRKPLWDNYRDKVSNQRKRGRNDKGAAAAAGIDTITVQRVSAQVEGKCQKYSRIGPLTLVPLMGKEPTLDNIKEACKLHFNTGMDCDVLAGERGPSFSNEKQIQNWKLLHIRFIEGAASSISDKRKRQSEPTASPEKAAAEFRSPRPVKSLVIQSSVVPSVSLSQMIRVGKLILPVSDVVILNLEEFSIEHMQWLKPFEVTISLERKAFSAGGFREAYLAKSVKGLPEGDYVLKKYKKEEKDNISNLFGSIEAHTRKSVQLNALAKNMAQNMDLEAPLEFGNTFNYEKVFFSSLNDDFVTLEVFLDGKFVKYINNTGELCLGSNEEVRSKAETFVHFTYAQSKELLMVTDIQGVGYRLCDPEISSTKQVDETDNSIFFCNGNLSTGAINTFKAAHKCNRYCKLMNLESFQVQSSQV